MDIHRGPRRLFGVLSQEVPYDTKNAPSSYVIYQLISGRSINIEILPLLNSIL